MPKNKSAALRVSLAGDIGDGLLAPRSSNYCSREPNSFNLKQIFRKHSIGLSGIPNGTGQVEIECMDLDFYHMVSNVPKNGCQPAEEGLSEGGHGMHERSVGSLVTRESGIGLTAMVSMDY